MAATDVELEGLPLLTEEEWWAFDTMGFLKVKKAFSPSEVKEAAAAAAAAATHAAGNEPLGCQFDHPVLLGYARQLCGPRAATDATSHGSLLVNQVCP